jgi:hypothetical protein
MREMDEEVAASFEVKFSNGKNDDLGGSSSTKPEGGLIQKWSEETDHLTVSKTYISTAHKAMTRTEVKSWVPCIRCS